MLLTSLQQLVFPSRGCFGLLTPCATSLPPPHTNTLPACSPSAVFAFPSTTCCIWFPERKWGVWRLCEEADLNWSALFWSLSSIFLYPCALSVLTVCVCVCVRSRLQIWWTICQQVAFCSLQGDSGASVSLCAPLASLMMVLIGAVSRIMVGYCFKIPGTEDVIKNLNILIKNRSRLCNTELQADNKSTGGLSIFKILHSF